MRPSAAILAAALLLAPIGVNAQVKLKTIDAQVRAGMAKTGAKGIAVAVIDHGKIVSVRTWGARNAKDEPLTPATVMYGASLTKAVFAYTVLQLAAEKRIDLDASIATYLKQPLPDYGVLGDRYADWSGLEGDERWRKLTPRILLQHSAGFANFGFLEPDGKLRIHFEPGSRYAYSGDGIILLQFVLEQGLGLDLGHEMQARAFTPFGMKTTSMMWRPDFAANLADGWTAEGKPEPHDERSKVRAAGSMDTTIADFARFAAAFMRSDGLTKALRGEMLRPQLPITTATQFPTLQPELPEAAQIKGLSAGLGIVTFRGAQGRASTKAGITIRPAIPGSASNAARAASSSCRTTFAPRRCFPVSSAASWAKPARPGPGNMGRSPGRAPNAPARTARRPIRHWR